MIAPGLRLTCQGVGRFELKTVLNGFRTASSYSAKRSIYTTPQPARSHLANVKPFHPSAYTAIRFASSTNRISTIFSRGASNRSRPRPPSDPYNAEPSPATKRYNRGLENVQKRVQAERETDPARIDRIAQEELAFQYAQTQAHNADLVEESKTGRGLFYSIIAAYIIIFGLFQFPVARTSPDQTPEQNQAARTSQAFRGVLTKFCTSSSIRVWEEDFSWPNLPKFVLPHFSHAEVWHLVFCAVTLNAFLPMLAKIYGTRRTLVVYLIGGVGSTLLQALYEKAFNPMAKFSSQQINAHTLQIAKAMELQKRDPSQPVPANVPVDLKNIRSYVTPGLGSSTSLSAMLAILACSAPKMELAAFGIPALSSTIRTITALIIAFDAAGQTFDFGLGIGHLGHLGGYFAGGLMYALWLRRAPLNVMQKAFRRAYN